MCLFCESVAFPRSRIDTIGVARGVQGAMPPQFLAYPVILCFEKWRPKQKYCCSPKIKHVGPSEFFDPPKNFWAIYATVTDHVHNTPRP